MLCGSSEKVLGTLDLGHSFGLGFSEGIDGIYITDKRQRLKECSIYRPMRRKSWLGTPSGNIAMGSTA
jgi:hypothetical protein